MFHFFGAAKTKAPVASRVAYRSVIDFLPEVEQASQRGL
jgi:hypothetical protein